MRSKRMTYRNRLYLLFVLAMLIPLSVLCMVFYNISVKSVRETARHVYANMLEQTVARIDSEFEQIRRMSEAYAGSKWVSQIAHMQGKEIDYDRLNVYMLYQYGDLIGRMEASNRYSNRSAIVFVQKEACMLNNGLWNTDALFRSEMRIGGMEPKEALAFVGRNQETTYVYADQESDHDLYVIRRIPLMEKACNVQLVMKISYSSIERILSDASGMIVRCAPPEGRVIQSGNAGALREDEPGRYLVLTATSALNGWAYSGYVDKAELSKDLASLRRLLLIVVSTVILLSVAAGVLLMSTAYKPVKALSEQTGDRRLGGADALERLRANFDSMSQNNRSLLHKVDAYGPLAQEALFTNVICRTISGEKMRRVAGEMGISLDRRRWAAAVFQFDGELTGSIERRLADLNNYVLHIELGRIAAIAGREDDCLPMIEEWKKLAFSAGVTCGISCVHERLEEVSSAYIEATIALQLSSVEKPALYSEAASNRLIAHDYPQQAENALANAIQQGDYEKAYAVLSGVIDRNREQNLLSQRSLMYDVLATILRVCGQDHLALENLKLRQLSMHDFSKLKFTVFEALREACRKEKDARPEDDGRRQQAEAMLRFIRENYSDENMSLSLFAEHFGFSLQYASKICKDVCGDNFVDTLMRVRIDAAKSLIEKESLTLEEVGRRVGYASVTTFQRAFKKAEGITPREYKARVRE